MKKITILLVATCCLFGFAGCFETKAPENSQKNVTMSSGEVVGKLPDGREVHCYKIDRGVWYGTHFLYVIDGAYSISNNYHENKTDNVQAVIGK